jgi:hypothetical protein
MKIKVFDKDTGSIIYGATVTVYDESGINKVDSRTTESGSADILLHEGKYIASIEAAGYSAQKTRFTVSIVKVRFAYKGKCCSDCGAGILNACNQDECISLGNGACTFSSILGTFYGTCAFGGQQQVVCTDTDGGKVYEVAGNTKLSSPIVGQLFEANDWCNADNKTLVEYYCTDDPTAYIKSENYVCPNACADGACVAANCAVENGNVYDMPDKGPTSCCAGLILKSCEGVCTPSILGTCAKCAAEGQYTSGTVAPEFYIGCCEGLTGFNTHPGLVGGGSLCYNAAKGTPQCSAVGTRSEGWYYSTTSGLIRYETCGQPTPVCGDGTCNAPNETTSTCPADCGGKLCGTACTSAQFCEVNSCTAPTSGACVTVPELCTMDVNPVCGCNGKTYSNDCARKGAKVSKSHDGKC